MKITLVDSIEFHTYCEAPGQAYLDRDCDCAGVCGNLDIPPLAYPTIYSLELTPSCNNRCPGCSNVFFENTELRMMTPSRLPMSLGHWRTIVAKIAPHAERLKLTGGEATLHPQFEEIVETIVDYDLSFTLFTNGRWLDPKRLTSFLTGIPQCMGLLVSLHGADAFAHEAFTGIEGSFEETIENIRLATQAGLTIHTNTVFTRYNHHQIEAIVDMSQSLGAECAVFNRYVGKPIPDLDLPLETLMQAVRTVDHLGQGHQKTKFGTCVPLCFVESSSTGCLAGTAYCTIDPWGNVRPCNHAPQIAGNLFTESLESIWGSTTMNAWRNLIPNECKTCSAYSKCHGGCRADAVLKGVEYDPLMSAPLLPSPLTSVAREQDLQLYSFATPRLEYTLRDELFGPVLTKGSDIIPISIRAKSFLSAIDQSTTLSQLHNDFGPEAIDFVGHLYDRGAVTLTW